MDIKKIIAAGKAVAALDPRGAGAVAAIEAVVALVDDVRETIKASDAEMVELSETRAALEARVNAHADRTAANLAD